MKNRGSIDRRLDFETIRNESGDGRFAFAKIVRFSSGHRKTIALVFWFVRTRRDGAVCGAQSKQQLTTVTSAPDSGESGTRL